MSNREHSRYLGLAEGPGMPYHYNDGGRPLFGFRGKASDCTCRAIAIAAKIPYKRVYDDLNALGKLDDAQHPGRKGKSGARSGVFRSVYEPYILGLGFEWVPTMEFGKGCTTHLKTGELPLGRLIVRVSRHMVAVIDGHIHDTYDPSRGGARCVYGVFVHESQTDQESYREWRRKFSDRGG